VNIRVQTQAAARCLFRLPVLAVRRVREQADRETQAQLLAQLAALDYPQSVRHHEPASSQPLGERRRARADDPLELLWKLPARRPRRVDDPW
jgi:hypothetical protein